MFWVYYIKKSLPNNAKRDVLIPFTFQTTTKDCYIELLFGNESIYFGNG